ncbi:M43 family zinc metalloprotease [Ferruginibacter sp.]|uniref:M43 family zinc metalloprotease n=3 Tax=Ferruginibacter sp. TaxID=1940288 RepID=UPI002659BAB0|nr:M43 family zinc metalloprotease [Ferruginibacter sp.]
MKNIVTAICFLLVNGIFSGLIAQKKLQNVKQEQCATMVRLEDKFKQNPGLKASFTRQLESFNRTLADKIQTQQRNAGSAGINSPATTYTIPIVFHIVLPNPTLVTDAQIIAQLDVLNKDYSGTNEDAANLPSYFHPIFGQSPIQFCLAQRTPTGEITNGIERITTTQTPFSPSNDGVKHTSTGGIDLWDGTKYFNVWITALSNNLLGYGTFPNDGFPLEQGAVVEYRSLPNGVYNNYNQGKTLSHETGHYFNLYHIWGDDNGACTGTDYVDDTPNQADFTTGCYNGVRIDSCTSTGNGILYQNYMDYSYDQCMILFTKLQVVRMTNALLSYRSSLTSSNGCTPVELKTLDAQLKTIDAPTQRICTNSFSPVVTIRNMGLQTLNTLLIKTVIDNGTPVSYSWTGSLSSLASDVVTLSAVTITPGNHQIKIFVASPNAGTDENNTNDTLTTAVQYYEPVASVTEGFEGNIFPPAGWDVVNPDHSITWQKITGVAKTGNASVIIRNFDYTNLFEKDYLRLPEVNLINVDSAFFSFQVAAAVASETSLVGNNWDTLEVLISKDCGLTYTSLYKKWDSTLITTYTNTLISFVPASSEWRKDSIDLTPYINQGKIMLAFRNTTGNENNIYLDDISIRTININPNLKAAGFLVTPNPVKNSVAVQFYPNPSNLKSIQLYNLFGQKLAETNISSGAGLPLYTFNMSRYPAGAYIVRAVFTDKVIVKKIIKE